MAETIAQWTRGCDLVVRPFVHFAPISQEMSRHVKMNASVLRKKVTMTRKRAASGDKSLGMNDSITRRDFLGSTLLASGALLLESITPAELLAATDEFTGYGGVGEYSTSNGNTQTVMQAGHTIRDRAYVPLPKDLIETGE